MCALYYIVTSLARVSVYNLYVRHIGEESLQPSGRLMMLPEQWDKVNKTALRRVARFQNAQSVGLSFRKEWIR